MTEVLLFARAREVAGARRVELGGSTVSEVLASASARFGEEFAGLCERCTVVVDGDVVHRRDFDSTAPGAELAVLPPVSGGSHTVGDRPDGIRVAVLTVSDRASAGDYADETGPAVESVATARLEARVVARALVADEHEQIAETIRQWCDEGTADLVLTNGGTGLSPRDLTPEATRSVLDVEAPGLAELMRSVGLSETPLAALSRQVVGRRGHTIVVNLPGSVRGATQSLEAVVDVLGHAVAMARTQA